MINPLYRGILQYKGNVMKEYILEYHSGLMTGGLGSLFFYLLVCFLKKWWALVVN